MAGIWHFLPGVSQEQLVDRSHAINREVLARFGLDQVLRDVRRHPEDAILTPLKSGGPGGLSGSLIYPVSPRADMPPNPGYDPGTQTFLQRGERWLGYLTAEPIKPMCLERRRMVNGYFAVDRWAHQWVVPVLRGKDTELGSLPVEFVFGEGPLPVAKIGAEYRDLWEDGKRAWDHLQGIASQAADWLAGLVARAIAVNYRLGVDELWLLDQAGQNLMDADFVMEALNALVDFGAAEDYAAQKKRLTSLIRLAG